MAKVTITFEDQADKRVVVSTAIEPMPQVGEAMPMSVLTAIKVRRFLDMDEKLHDMLCGCQSGKSETIPAAKGNA